MPFALHKVWVQKSFMLDLLPAEYWECNVNDVFRGLSAALSPRLSGDTIQIPGLGPCIPARSARAAIVLALQALDLPPAARIGVPLYCCPVVFKAIKAAGATPRFIDIDAATFCLSVADLRAKRSGLDAIIAVHMFGNLCDVPTLLEAAPGKPIVEDCAQSLGSRLGDRVTGSMGTIAALSFRSGKYLSVGEGGALFSPRADIRSGLSALVAALPTPGCGEECLHVFRTLLRSLLRRRPLYGAVGDPLWQIYNRKVDYPSKSPLVLGQMYRADLAVACRRLPRLGSAIAAQRANADLYSRLLHVDAGMLCPETPGTFTNRYLYPVTFPGPEQRDHVALRLRQNGVDTIKHLNDIADVARNHYGYPGDCPVSEFFAKRVLILPSYHTLKECRIARIAEQFNAAWAEIRSPRVALAEARAVSQKERIRSLSVTGD